MSTPLSHKHSSNPFARLVTQEIDDLAYHMKHADIELIQISRAKTPSSLTIVNFDKLDLQVGHYGASYISNASTDKEGSGLVFKINRDYPTVCNGYDIDNKSFMFYNKNSEHLAINKGPCKWAYITFKPDYFEESLSDCLQIDLDTRTGKSSCLQCQNQTYLGSLYGVINEITEIIRTDPGKLQDPNILKGMESSLLDSQILLLSNTIAPNTKPMDASKKSHESIIIKSIDFFKANSYKPIHVLDLCTALNVRVRTLYYAFQEFYGISPIRFLQMLRYAKARRDLIYADAECTTVSDIATKWHFWHFGRFSVEYKALYGESPSETLSKKF